MKRFIPKNAREITNAIPNRRMPKVGDILNLPVQLDSDKREKERVTVIWIHPEGRFFRGEYISGSGVPIRESYRLN